MIAILLTGIYTGRRNDFVSEVYHLIAILFATFITLHYFIGFGFYVAKTFFVPHGVQEAVAFYMLAGLILGFFLVAHGGWKRLLKIKSPDFLDQYGSLVLSIFRSFLYCGLLFLALCILRDPTISRDTRNSWSSPVFKQVSIATYGFIYQGIVHPVFRAEKFNDRVYHILVQPKKKQDTDEDESEAK